jgi:CBS domain-containing protein
MLLAGPQHDFPVVSGEEVIGLLTRSDILRGMSTVGPSAYIAEIMNREPKTGHSNDPLESAMEYFQSNDAAPVLIMGDNGLEGLLTSDNMSEFIMLEAARHRLRHA